MRLLRLFPVAIFCLSLTGCLGGTFVANDIAQEDNVEGAVLVAPATAKANEEITLDASGSQLGTGGPCPGAVHFYADDAPGAEHTIDEPTSDSGRPCKLTNGTFKVRLRGAATPGVRTQNISVEVQGLKEDDNTVVESFKTIQVKVETPGAAVVPTAAQATSTPAPGPSGGDSGGSGGGDHGGGDHGGGGHTPVGKGPVAQFVVNPIPGVAGEPLFFDARPSADEDGTIAQWNWDLDGDDQYDDSSGAPFASFVPATAGEREVGLEIVDNDGNRSYATHTNIPVAAAGHLMAEPPQLTPDTGINPAESVKIRVAGVDDADFVEYDRGDDYTTDGSKDPYDGATGWEFFESWPTVGTHRFGIVFVDLGTGQSSRWTQVVEVEPARRIASAAAAFKKLATTATMKTTGKVVSPGKLSFKGGELAASGVVLKGTIRGGVAKAARKNVPPGLRGLYRSEYVGSFSGSRVSLSPSVYTLRGTGTILARPQKDKKTLVCLSVKTDGGVTPGGSTWRTLGATGKAAGFTASGGFAPLVVGAAAPSTPTTLTAKRSSRKALPAACSALKKHLAPVKKAKRKK